MLSMHGSHEGGERGRGRRPQAQHPLFQREMEAEEGEENGRTLSSCGASIPFPPPPPPPLPSPPSQPSRAERYWEHDNWEMFLGTIPFFLLLCTVPTPFLCPN